MATNQPDDLLDPLYGPQTIAAIGNFTASGETVPQPLIAALAAIKAEAAIVNAELNNDLDSVTAQAISDAANEVAAGQHAAQFPIDIFQTGSGTSTNMNVNEVIATLAGRRLANPVHPNDQVNMSQSTNDTFPSAIRIACLGLITAGLLPALDGLVASLRAKALEYGDVVKAGRTHHMDATPILLGDEFHGYADQVDSAADRLRRILPDLGRLPLGGTATGNGLNAPIGFASRVAGRLSDRLDLKLVETDRHFAHQGAQDDLVDLSAQLRGAAVSLFKIANDIRLMASGPRTGFAELIIPPLQAGSSIMPGKSNPVICEVVTQVAAQVIGNDAATAFAGTQGALELNVYMPVIARNVIASIELLTNASASFTTLCIARLEVDRERCQLHAEHTLATAAALNLELGYDVATEIVKAAIVSGRSLRDELAARDIVTGDEINDLLDLTKIATGTITRS